MAVPTTKSSEMNALLNAMTGVDRVSTIEADVCVMCKKPAVEFKDELSKAEYAISGMCQACQDSVFG